MERKPPARSHMDILLVNPIFLKENAAERELMTPYFPLGLLYLAAFLRERGFSVEIFDGTFTGGPGDFIPVLETHRPRYVGITVVQPNRQVALELAQAARDSGATVIVGGPDPTRSPGSFLADPAVDIVVHHEGEITLAALLEASLDRSASRADLAEMPGIAYLDPDGQLRVNPRRPYILNLDELPFPARDLIDMEAYLDFWTEHNGYASVTISVARGCPFGCAWCQDAVHGASYRQRSPANVVAEVQELMTRYNVDRLRVVNDVDGIQLDWLETWAQEAERQGAVVPFEGLNELERQDIPMLDVRDSL